MKTYPIDYASDTYIYASKLVHTQNYTQNCCCKNKITNDGIKFVIDTIFMLLTERKKVDTSLRVDIYWDNESAAACLLISVLVANNIDAVLYGVDLASLIYINID